MNAGSGWCLSTCQIIRQDHHRMNLVSLKRTVRPFLGPSGRGEASYPSPPMSNPPSPLQYSRDEGNPLVTTSSEQSTTVPTPIAATSMPDVAISAPALALSSFQAPSLTGHLPSLSTTASQSFSIQSAGSGHHALTSSNILQSARGTPSGPRSSDLGGGRKSKAHVASACVNCKKAHLSCDVNRPCARCVASGKQDTCYDVQHKKRGRPRLREEGDFKVEQMPSAAVRSNVMIPEADVVVRPIASTRHRRQESFRSLRSQGSDGSGISSSPTYPYPPPPTATQATFDIQHPFTLSAAPEYEIPTAYLNLDLTFLKSNAPFRQIMLAGQEIVGRALGEVAAPVDGESFSNIRSRIRAEREARDPAHMPPINRPGHDPLQGASIADVERYTHGFEDHTHFWTQTQLGVAAQRFPARVRLAKANTYWVAITLPSYHPLGHISTQPAPFLQMQPMATRFQMQPPDSYASGRQTVSHSTPLAGTLPLPVSAMTLQPPMRAMGQPTASPTFTGPPHEQTQAAHYPRTGTVMTPRLPVAEPPTETTAFTPRTTTRELSNPNATPGRLVAQLPPLMGTPAPSARPTTGGPSSSQLPGVASKPVEPHAGDDADVHGRSSKRRRMGIDDVVHR
ncbi:hypothetical protein DOTSEDRAFT_74440 [Dothistroma septosporum NZE10]|uniref:Zn(2)-C6 fungal-type domain-containing protein n=1 Tax=Dothistroma septosporum (strain NZE10 / CBS 128990) TaxID=675120 RepID=N1PET8_DOTSN|nr:hypothetical protein DOTSEDRAFT_74440 [Dothistroma septosporum NZE10]